MVHFKPMLSLIIIVGVVQVCTAKAIAVEEEKDVTELFTADELERARNVGITDIQLIRGKSFGLTAYEMTQIFLAAKADHDRFSPETNETNIEQMGKICGILVPQHKNAANISKSQQTHLEELHEADVQIPRKLQFYFLRTHVCSYLSKPLEYERNASLFGLKLTTYMKFDFWKLQNQNATGVDRVNTAKELCCIYKGRENIAEFKVRSNEFSSSDQKMKDFEKHWNHFETTKTSESFGQICEFLSATNPAEEC